MLDRQHPPVTEPPAPARSAAELADVVNSIAALWPTFSQREIARKLGVRPGVVSGLVGRARRNGDERFPRRPKPSPKRKAPPKPRKLKPIGEHIGNARPLRPPPVLAGPIPFLQLRSGMCKFPLNSPEHGSVSAAWCAAGLRSYSLARAIAVSMKRSRDRVLALRLRLARHLRLDKLKGRGGYGILLSSAFAFASTRARNCAPTTLSR